ncbi:hypothetical protein ACFL4N_06240 [Thermodesulfobacteriota bacterium]
MSGKKIMRKPFFDRPCIHAQEGRAEMPKICIHHSECWHCPFDQWIEEIEGNPHFLDFIIPKSGGMAKAA